MRNRASKLGYMVGALLIPTLVCFMGQLSQAQAGSEEGENAIQIGEFRFSVETKCMVQEIPLWGRDEICMTRILDDEPWVDAMVQEEIEQARDQLQKKE